MEIFESSFGAEGDDGIYAGGATGGQPACDRDAETETDDGAEPDQWVGRRKFGPLMAHDAGDGPNGDAAGEKSEHEQARALRRDELNEGAGGRAERETNSKFTGPPRDLQREQA